jgi:uncharacterized Zn finger protein (UPF0148 family)
VRDGVTTQPPACARCGAVLARDHAGAALCSPCARSAPESPPARRLEPDRLAYAIAGMLLLQRGLHPGKKVRVQTELVQCGIAATTAEIAQAVRKIRRRKIKILAREREPGYLPLGFADPFRRQPRRRLPQIPLL